MSDYEYNGPRVPRTHKNEIEVRRRFLWKARAITDVRCDEAVQAWAEADEGRFPDKKQIMQEVSAELETLCRALDAWGAVDPDFVLGPEQAFPDFGDMLD